MEPMRNEIQPFLRLIYISNRSFSVISNVGSKNVYPGLSFYRGPITLNDGTFMPIKSLWLTSGPAITGNIPIEKPPVHDSAILHPDFGIFTAEATIYVLLTLFFEFFTSHVLLSIALKEGP